jgi:hypothetical protein
MSNIGVLLFTGHSDGGKDEKKSAIRFAENGMAGICGK